MRRWVFLALAALFYGAAVLEGLFTPIGLDLPIAQLENILLLAAGAGFLIAFLQANTPAASAQTPVESATVESATSVPPPLRRRRRRTRRRET